MSQANRKQRRMRRKEGYTTTEMRTDTKGEENGSRGNETKSEERR